MESLVEPSGSDDIGSGEEALDELLEPGASIPYGRRGPGPPNKNIGGPAYITGPPNIWSVTKKLSSNFLTLVIMLLMLALKAGNLVTANAFHTDLVIY